MKSIILSTVIINFLNFIHPSKQDCKTKTTCIPKNQPPGAPIEVGIIYDKYEDATKNKALVALDALACQVIGEFGGSLTFKRYPGATVQSTQEGIKCQDDCWRNRENACIGMINGEYFTNCEGADVGMASLTTCTYGHKSDQILIANGNLRCSSGIPKSKIPALIFNQVYDPCHTFSTADELKKFLCATYSQALKGKGCN